MRFAFVLLFFPLTLVAQVGGTVTDPFNAPIAGANVTLRNLDRNQTQSATTDTRGRFRFPTVAIGTYQLRINAKGFADAEERLRVAIGAVLDVPIRLQVAQSETISVTASMPVVETGRTQVATSISPEEMRELPLNGRNYLDLALLAPGVSRTNTGANQRFAETSAVPGTGISVSTQRNLANSFVVDGLSANDDAAELAGTFFSQEVIREFAVVRAGGSAELGRASAGIINIATQSGTNVFRGDAYAYVRNDRFESEKHYGASIGGPLLRDRTFFFANVEQMRQRGDGVITISPESVAAINARLGEVSYAGPRISTGTIDTSLDTTNTFARADHTASSADQLTLRFNSYDVTSANARSAGGLNAISRGTALENHDRTLAASNLLTLSANVISETRAQLTRSRLSAPPNDVLGPAVTISGIA